MCVCVRVCVCVCVCVRARARAVYVRAHLCVYADRHVYKHALTIQCLVISLLSRIVLVVLQWV